MNSPIYATPTQQRAVSCINNGIHFELGDITNH